MVLGLILGIASGASAKPLKVFILAGQSNIPRHANVSTFDSMADDPKTAPILKEMRNTTHRRLYNLTILSRRARTIATKYWTSYWLRLHEKHPGYAGPRTDRQKAKI